MTMHKILLPKEDINKRSIPGKEGWRGIASTEHQTIKNLEEYTKRAKKIHL